MDGVATHIDNILNEVLVLFLACIHQGVQCSYHWYTRAVSTVESYQIREITQEGIAHSSDGIAKTANLSLEGFFVMRDPAHGEGNCRGSLCHNQEGILLQTALAAWSSLALRASIVEKQQGFLWAQQLHLNLSQSCSPAREPGQMGSQKMCSWSLKEPSENGSQIHP